MDDSSIRRLNQMNRAFYALTVEDFDESRGRPWPGWRRLLPYLERRPDTGEGTQPRVLDVGCGNGRFGCFLARSLTVPVRYHGLDSAPTLLNAAREAFTRLSILHNSILEERDIVENPPDSGEYDFVGVFGVLHHVPGGARRLELIRALAGRVAPGGYLAFAAWCFYEYERFRERLLPLPKEFAPEPGDYLMDWRRGHAANTALRYCHYIDDAEHASLIAATGLTLVETFRADGHTGDINRYSVLTHPQAG